MKTEWKRGAECKRKSQIESRLKERDKVWGAEAGEEDTTQMKSPWILGWARAQHGGRLTVTRRRRLRRRRRRQRSQGRREGEEGREQCWCWTAQAHMPSVCLIVAARLLGNGPWRK